MKQSIRTLAMMGLAAVMAAPAISRAEELDTDMRVRLEAIEEAIDGLNKKNEELGSVNFEGFVNLRYDREANPSLGVPGFNAAGTTPLDTNLYNNGTNGLYARRAESKWTGRFGSSAVWSLGYDFAENKIKDLGIEFRDLPLVPFLDMPEWNQVIRVGQYRMPFGVMPQQSSSATLFPERAYINGGRTNNGSALPVVATVGERIMGAQGRHKKTFTGITAYDFQYGVFNNYNQDQAAGQNRITTAFPNQFADDQLSWGGRFAVDHNYIYGFLPEKSVIRTGASYFSDSVNNTPHAQAQFNRITDEVIGAEFVVELNNKLITSHTEWIHINNDIRGNVSPQTSVPNGVSNTSEGWYSDLAIDLLPMFTAPEKGDALQVMFRIEEQLNFNGRGAFKPLTRLGTGLKWSYLGGKNHTSLTYMVSAPDHQYGGDYRSSAINGSLGNANGTTGFSAPESTIILQQQWAWETGKF